MTSAALCRCSGGIRGFIITSFTRINLKDGLGLHAEGFCAMAGAPPPR